MGGGGGSPLPAAGAPVPEQKLLLLTVLAEPPEELGGLNSRLSSSEKGDSEAGDTFWCWCWYCGRRTRRGMRLRDASFSGSAFCSFLGKEEPPPAVRALRHPRRRAASGLRPRGWGEPGGSSPAGAARLPLGKDRGAPCPSAPFPPATRPPPSPSPPSPARPPAPSRSALTLPLSRRGPMAPSVTAQPGTGTWHGRERRAQPPPPPPPLLPRPLLRCGWRSPARPRRSPPRHVVPPPPPPHRGAEGGGSGLGEDLRGRPRAPAAGVGLGSGTAPRGGCAGWPRAVGRR